MANKKRMILFLAIIVLVVIVAFLLLKQAPTSGNTTSNTPNLPSQNQASSPQSQGNNNAAKGNYSAYYPLDWQKPYLDRPTDIVSMLVSGNYNQITVSAQTEVSKITLTGAHNNVLLCTGNYPTPEILKIGVSNQVNYTNC